MKPISKFILKLFFVTLVSSALLLLVIHFIRHGFLETKILEALMFGIVFSLSTVLFYYYMIDGSYPVSLDKLKHEDFKAKQKRHIRSKLTLFEVKRKLIDSKYFKARKISFQDETLCFKKKFSSFSWGEYISIKQAVFNADEEYTYEIISRPVFPLQWFDYGVNYKNVQELESLIC